MTVEACVANERVLVIDDGKDLRDFVVNYVLIPNNFEVLVARNGSEGLQKALREEPDFIIVDMQMPRMSGLEVLQALAERGRDIPSILVTAHGSEELAVAAFRAGARDYIIKPFEADEVLDAINRALRDVRRRQDREMLGEQLKGTSRQLRDQVQQLNTLSEIGRSVTSLLDLEPVLHRVVEASVFITNADEGTLLLLDEETDELYVRASKNLDNELVRSMRLKVHDSLAGQVVHSGAPILIGEKGWHKIKTEYLVKSLLYVPLKVRGKTIGVLGVANKVKSDPFSKRDEQLLLVLGGYAAVAIQNALLFASTEVERSKLEAILRESENLVTVIDPNGRLALVNKAAQAAFKVDEDVLGMPLPDAIKHPDLIRLVERKGDRSTMRQAEIALEDGRIFNAHMTTIEAVGHAVVMQDITHLKELDRIKSEFVSVVSHDLRSPLTAILGYVELLPRVGPINEAQEEFIRRVRGNVNHITALISDLLDLGRIEAGFDREMESYHLNRLIRDVVEGLRPSLEEKQQRLELDLAPHVPPNRGSPLRLRQAINNLIGNAVKYTPTGGTVSIETKLEASQAVMRVRDTGVGIPRADQPYIFDKFYRAEAVADSHQGTGLGLAIVKSVIERHHGRIWVESEPDRGSVFSVVLPIVA
jgi:two-component system NtrC family sensor kinase